MGFLYALTNVLAPVALLVYQSLVHFNASKQVPYGKWTLLIITLYLFSWVSWVFSSSYLIYFLDLSIKLAISFIPDNINHKIQDKLTNLHLQIWFDQFRCWFIGAVHKYYWKVTELLLLKMESDERTQFKEGLIRNLNEETGKSHTQMIFKPQKQFVNTGVNCQSLTAEIAQTISSTAKKLQEYSKKVVNEKALLHNETFGQIKPTRQPTNLLIESKRSEPKKVEQKLSSAKHEVKKQLPKFHYVKNQPVSSNTVPAGLNLRQSQHNLDLQDFEQHIVATKPQKVISPIHNKNQEAGHVVFKTVGKKTQQPIKHEIKPLVQRPQSKLKQEFKRAYTFTDYTSSEISSRPENYQKPYREDGDPFSEDLLNKLDLSASEYSDMFDEEDEEDLKVLECKVEVILEIGIGSTVRLQIYNIELYSNSDLRILSPYDRQFETHKLKSMRPLPNSYYELVFEGSKIGSRKCKFRGQHQPFMKYLEQ